MTDSLIGETANLLGLGQVGFKKLDVSNCCLGDTGLSKLWTGIAGQSTSLEALDTSENQGTVKFEIIRFALSQLRAVKSLNIAGNTRLTTEASLFDEAALNSWNLQQLDLSGISVCPNFPFH